MRLPAADIFFRFRKKSQRKGWVGTVWRMLERVGPVTRSSPARRAIQAICLVLFLDAFFARDIPVVQGCVLVIAVIYVVVNLVVDLAYGVVDPRVRLS